MSAAKAQQNAQAGMSEVRKAGRQCSVLLRASAQLRTCIVAVKNVLWSALLRLSLFFDAVGKQIHLAPLL